MISFIKRLWNDRRGNALVLAGAALPMVLGSAGLASDTIQWTLWKRQLQRAADSAAIAGVYAKYQAQNVNSAVSTDLSKNHHTGIGLVSGYPQIQELPNTSNYDNAVKVSLAVQKRLGFSSLFLSSPPVIKVEATAASTNTGEYCVISLESSAATGISVGGNASVDLGCGMITNSTSLDAAVAFGSSIVNASPVAAVGGLDPKDNWGPNTQLLPFTLAQQDPFKNVPAPTTFPNGNCPQLRVNSNSTTNRTSDTGQVCFSNMDVRGTLNLGSATYVIDGGSVSINAQAKVSCNGCTIVLTNRSISPLATIGNVTINGGAQLNLTAPSTGTYKGLIFYQDRRAQSGNSANRQNKINGNSSSSFQGAFYFPSQDAEFTGNAGMQTNCVQLVSLRVTFSGNSGISNNCPPNSGSQSFKGRHVRLIA